MTTSFEAAEPGELDAATAAWLAGLVPTAVREPGAPVPEDHDHLDVSRALAPDAFASAGRRLLTWRMHTGAGLRVRASEPAVAVGVVAVLTATVGPFEVDAPVRVVEVVDEPSRVGFSYATLPGHPERGIESFLIERHEDGAVTARFSAFSLPDRWFTRLAPSIARGAQNRITTRYFEALARR